MTALLDREPACAARWPTRPPTQDRRRPVERVLGDQVADQALELLRRWSRARWSRRRDLRRRGRAARRRAALGAAERDGRSTTSRTSCSGSAGSLERRAGLARRWSDPALPADAQDALLDRLLGDRVDADHPRGWSSRPSRRPAAGRSSARSSGWSSWPPSAGSGTSRT